MPREYPIVWIIGATRSCKSALAEHGVVPLGFRMISTADYFRAQYGMEDTFSREFVFQLSHFSAGHLAQGPDCNLRHLEQLIAEAHQPCVIEGERNPAEFARLYDPQKDMAIFLHRVDMDVYDTTIERGIPVIEQLVRWNVNNGIAPRASAFKASFGDTALKGEYFGMHNGPDVTFIEGPIKLRKPDGDTGDRYPWIGILVGMTREKIREYLGACLRPLPQKSPAAMTPATAPAG